MNREYFCVNVKLYKANRYFNVYRPASLNHPKDQAVMFVTESFIQQADQLLKCDSCLVFWPESVETPSEIDKRHAVISCKNPRLSYCEFYRENNIGNRPANEEVELIGGAWISKKAKIGEGVSIFPGAYISGGAVIGKNVFIGSGVKLIGDVFLGDNTVIRENTVIGADGLSTDRDPQGKAVTMPQFGGVVIEDHVMIGANTTIARGAIDHTLIGSGCKIDNNCFISHNVQLGNDTFVVGESILFGSSRTGKRVYISGNSTVRNGIYIGDDAVIGMGSVVVKDVPGNVTIKGNPAR